MVKQASAAPAEKRSDEIIISKATVSLTDNIPGLVTMASHYKNQYLKTALIPMHEIWVTAEHCMQFSISTQSTTGAY